MSNQSHPILLLRFLHCLKVLCLISALLVSGCKKDEQTTQPVVPTPPQVRIVSPLNNSSIGAGLVPVLVEATDDKGVAKVEVYVDSQLDTTLSVPPYRYLRPLKA